MAHLLTYKSRAVVAKSGLHVSGFLKVMNKAQAKFGADDTGSHEISCDLISVDKSFSVQTYEKWDYSTILLMKQPTTFTLTVFARDRMILCGR